MIRYRAKKWWSLKESPDGQYVAYHEHEEAMNKLRHENDKLWERITQQVEEYEKLKADRLEWIERHGQLADGYCIQYARKAELEATLRYRTSIAWILAAVMTGGLFFILLFALC